VLRQFLVERSIAANVLEPQKGRASVVAKVPGTDPGAPSLLLLSHLDVVSAGNLYHWVTNRCPPISTVDSCTGEVPSMTKAGPP
jgi:acetylornithine deacetylase/succinyl-diaminopimelate desuccinylase-like protein